MDFQTHKKQLLLDPIVKKAYDKSELEYQIARALIKARIEKGLTQAVIAKKMKTKQSVISRVENAKTVPSLSFLKRLAHVLGAELHLEFRF